MSDVRPVRIQRKRTRGWKMPENCVYVGRPTDFGNPFYVGGHFMRGDPDPKNAGPFRMIYCSGPADDPRMTLIETPDQAVEWYRWLRCEAMPFSGEKLKALRGKNLACWCPLVDGRGNHVHCHADILLELANGGRDEAL